MIQVASRRGWAKRAVGTALDVGQRQRAVDPTAESIYQYLFVRDITALGLTDTFYPVGNAASYGLLYLLARCVMRFEFATIVEFGAGQSTVLIDALLGCLSRKSTFLTFEQDAWWAETVGASRRTPVTHAPLIPTQALGHDIMFYDLAVQGPIAGPSLVVVDGPAASRRDDCYNRLGAVPFLVERLEGEFIVIFDDTERPAEAGAASSFASLIGAKGAPVFEHAVRGAKQQRLFCTGSLREAAYF